MCYILHMMGMIWLAYKRAITYRKSPSHFSCFITYFTIGVISTLLIIVATMKNKKQPNGPCHPDLLKRKHIVLIKYFSQID